jgi:hypothetical protein
MMAVVIDGGARGSLLRLNIFCAVHGHMARQGGQKAIDLIHRIRIVSILGANSLFSYLNQLQQHFNGLGRELRIIDIIV